MLTEANLKEHLLKAYFVDENRTLIEVLYTSLDFKETHSVIIEYDLKHPDCQALLEVMSLDDLHCKYNFTSNGTVPSCGVDSPDSVTTTGECILPDDNIN